MGNKCSKDAMQLALHYLKSTNDERYEELNNDFPSESSEIDVISSEIVSPEVARVPEGALVQERDSITGGDIKTTDEVLPEDWMQMKSNVLEQAIAKFKNDIYENCLARFITKNSSKQTVDDILKNYKNSLIPSDLSPDMWLNKLEENIHTISTSDKINAYIYSNFDELLTRYIPYITIVDEGTEQQSYSYVKGRAKQESSWSSNDFIDFDAQVSDLMTTILDNAPCYNKDGNALSAKIGLQGFKAVMINYRTYLESDPDRPIGDMLDINWIINDITSDNSSWQHWMKDRRAVGMTLYAAYGVQKLIQNLKENSKNNEFAEHLLQNLIISSLSVKPSIYETVVVTPASKDSKESIEISINQPRILIQEETNLTNLVEGVASLSEFNIPTETESDDTQTLLETILDAAGISMEVLSDNQGIQVIYDDKKYNISVDDNGQFIVHPYEGDTTTELIEVLFNNVLHYTLPSSFFDTAANVLGSTSINSLNEFVGYVFYKLNGIENIEVPYNSIRNVAAIFANEHGMHTKSVVSDSDGNGLPLYQLPCLVFDFKRKLIDKGQLSFLTEMIGTPIFRLEAKTGSHVTSSSKYSANDLLRQAIQVDFYQRLYSESQQLRGIIAIQPDTFSDKGKHPLQTYDLSKYRPIPQDDRSFDEILRDYIDKNDESCINAIGAIKQEIGEKYEQQLLTIINNWHDVFGWERIDRTAISTEVINDINEQIRTKSIEEWRQAFANAENPINFVENIHAEKQGNSLGINKTLITLFNIFNTNSPFAKSFWEFNFTEFTKQAGFVKDILVTQFLNKNTKKAREAAEAKADRVLGAYFWIDVLFNNEYNRYMIGEIYAHPSKLSIKPENVNWGEVSEEVKEALLMMNARWVPQVKRNVIFGATYHPLGQGMTYGVPESFNTCIIDSKSAKFYNYLGEVLGVDANDGGGFTHPVASRMINHSLGEAAVGTTKKTIYHDLNPESQNAVLFKWAETELTNAIRRQSPEAEMLYQQLSTLPLKLNLSSSDTYTKDVSEYGLWVSDRLLTRVEINKANTGENIEEYVITLYTEDELENETIIESKSFATLAELDTALGGAFALIKEGNALVYTENNQDLMYKIICELNPSKDCFIAWAVDKSACKVGVTNLNPVSAWTSGNLNTFKMSTRYGGVQMDADHNLEDAEATEPTQMISALEQLGNTHVIVDKIYRELGEYVVSQVPEFTGTVSEEALYQVFGKSLIKSFQTGNKDVRGLANAFIDFAQQSITENGIEYKIPFSSQSIIGLFNSSVAVHNINNMIKRHFPGVNAVLVPSYDLFKLYTVGDKKLTWDEFRSSIQYSSIELDNEKQNPIFTYSTSDIGPRWDGDDDAHRMWVADQFGLLTILPSPTTLDVGDVIVHVVYEEGVKRYERIDIDSYEKLIVLQLLPETAWGVTNEGNPVWFKLEGAPRNLRGLRAKNSDGRELKTEISVFLQYLLKQTGGQHNTIEDYSDEMNSILKTKIDKDSILMAYFENTSILQQLEKYISEYYETGQEFDTFLEKLRESQRAVLVNYTMVSAEIVLGRQRAKEFGLTKDIKLNNVNLNHFKHLVLTKYGHINAREGDKIILSNGGQETIYVRTDLDSMSESTERSKFKIKNNILHFKGHELINVEGCALVQNGERTELYVPEYKLESIRNTNAFTFKTDNIQNLIGEKHRFYDQEAESLYESFKKSLRSITIRVPCQGQQSYCPSEVVAFSDSEVNTMYISTDVLAVQGCDYDIDKEVSVTYGVNNYGHIEKYNTAKSYSSEENKNRERLNTVMDDIWSAANNMNNLFNMTAPVNTDTVDALANSSSIADEGLKFNPYNPFSKYAMQVENMVGKEAIGVVAVSIKVYFALSFYYNQLAQEAAQLAEQGDYSGAVSLLQQCTSAKVANINYTPLLSIQAPGQPSFLEYCETFFPEIAKSIVVVNTPQNDITLLLGEFLNAAADNAKKLDLRKLNADPNWIDLYTTVIISGGNIKDIFDILTSDEGRKLVDAYSGSAFSTDSNFNRTEFLSKWAEETYGEGNIPVEILTLLSWSEKADEISLAGRILRINVKMPTNSVDFYKYVFSIERDLKKWLAYTSVDENNKPVKVAPDFNLFTFITNPEVQKQVELLGYTTKKVANIIGAVIAPTHIKAMLHALYATHMTWCALSPRNNIEFSVFNTVRNAENLSSSNMFVLKDIIDGEIRKNFLEKYVKSSGDETMAVWAKQFIDYFHNIVIDLQNSKYTDNHFLKNLTWNVQTIASYKTLLSDDVSKEDVSIPFLKLPINMLQMDDVYSTEQFKLFEEDLRKLNSETFNNENLLKGTYTFVELLYIYNMLIHNDRFGREAFTKLFDPYVRMGNIDSSNPNHSKRIYEIYNGSFLTTELKQNQEKIYNLSIAQYVNYKQPKNKRDYKGKVQTIGTINPIELFKTAELRQNVENEFIYSQTPINPKTIEDGLQSGQINERCEIIEEAPF